jgi:aconitate hydratase A / 2-methylisocitrate dehydratase
MWHDAEKEPVFSEYIELDLVDVVPSIAEPSESYLVLTSRAAGIEPPIDGVFPLLDDTAGPAGRHPSQHQDQINLDE